ncbi:helix-turn-helix domain-containing protein [Spirosoma areae]
MAVQLYEAKKTSIKKICELLAISKPTLYAYVRASQQPVGAVEKTK